MTFDRMIIFIHNQTRMSRQPESLIKQEICAYLRLRKDVIAHFWINSSVGIFDPVRKIYRSNNSAFARKGVSDILGITLTGRFFAIEVKSKKGIVSPEQKLFLEDINKAHGLAFVARSLKDVIDNLPHSR
jgi:hypothetical protein